MKKTISFLASSLLVGTSGLAQRLSPSVVAAGGSSARTASMTRPYFTQSGLFFLLLIALFAGHISMAKASVPTIVPPTVSKPTSADCVAPVYTKGGITSVCMNETIVLYTDLTRNSHTWIAPAGATLDSYTNAQVTASFTTSGPKTFTVTPQNYCTNTITITVKPTPAAPTLTGVSRRVDQSNTPLPLGQFANAENGNTLSFSGTSGVLADPPTTNISQVGTQSLSVTQTNAIGCVSGVTVFTLTVSEPPSPIRYVKAGGTGSGNSWADASGDLQSQINVTGAQQVWVATGTYKPGGTANTDINISFAMKNEVSILGGFPATGSPTLTERNPTSLTTVLSGDIGDVGNGTPSVGNVSDNSYHVIKNSGLTSTAVLDGFVIRDGYASYYAFSEAQGGGMYNDNSSPTLTNCRFIANRAYLNGGGIHNDAGSSPTLTNCSFVGNTGRFGGAINNVNSSPTLTNCRFMTNSSAVGAGMRNISSSPILTNCSFVDNTAGTTGSGGGMYNRDSSNPTLTNCSFVGNLAGYGGGINNDAGSSSTLTNCSFLGNSGQVYGGAMYYSGRLVLTNCVLFGNGGANTFVTRTPSTVIPTLNYSLLEPGVTGYDDGGNNITTTVSPFVSLTDARLNACSPAINTGNNGANATTTDLDGNPRRYNGGPGTPDRIDMGAYEYQAAPSAVTLTAPSGSTATVGVAFSQNFTAAGGSGPYSYTLASGSLPTGLSLDNTGVLSGTPTQAGSFTLIVLGRDATGCSGEGAPYGLTVLPAGPFAITGVTTISCTPILPNRFSVSFTPRYSSLTGQPLSFRVVNELLPTTEPGPYTLQLYTDNPRITLSAVQAGTAGEATYSYDWLDACRASESTNTPPRLVMAIPAQAATVGVGYSYVIPPGTFTDDQTPGSLRLSARGLPPGISLTGYTLSGVPSTTLGSPFSLTLTATDPGNLSVSTSVDFAVAPAPTEQPQPSQPFAITGVSLLSCTPVANRININFTPRYTGLTGQAIAFRVENELVATNEPVPYSLTLYRDNPVITLKATQTGSAGEASFAYNWLAACTSVGQDNTPPRVNSPVADQTATIGVGYSLNLANTFADQETPDQLSLRAAGLPAGLTLAGSTISGTASASGVSTVTITATDPGSLSVSTRFTITVVPARVEPPTPPVTAPFSLTGVTTVSCELISAGQRRVTFTPRYAGLDGSPVTFQVVNEKLPTTEPGPYTLNLYTDNPVITLSARQSGVSSSFAYDWRAACTPTARLGSGEAGSGLQVVVLGNPVKGETVEVEVRGATGESLEVETLNEQGYRVDRQGVESAREVERLRLRIGWSGGVYLLRVSSSSQTQTLKLLKQ